jgi:hypothetical protein
MANLLSTTLSGNNHITLGPNATWSSYLRVGGNGHSVSGNEYASVVTTNGNLHLDAGTSRAIYLNYYAGTSGVAFGNGASGISAWMGADGDLWKGGGDNSGTQYVYNSGTWGINISGDAAYSLNSTRLYASDAPYTYGGAAPYYMSMTYDGSRWLLKVTPGTPADVRVSYADSAGSAGSAGSLTSMNISQFTNNSGYITSVPTQSQLISPNGATVVAADSAMPNAGHSFIHTLGLGQEYG